MGDLSLLVDVGSGAGIQPLVSIAMCQTVCEMYPH